MQSYERFKDQNVAFVGLTPVEGDLLEETQAYLDEFGITWPNGYGATDVMQKLHAPGVGLKLVFDTQGKLVWHNLLPDGSLDQAIEKALAQAS